MRWTQMTGSTSAGENRREQELAPVRYLIRRDSRAIPFESQEVSWGLRSSREVYLFSRRRQESS